MSGMADANPRNAFWASTYETPPTLSSCLRLLIEILLNDVNTKHVESAVNNINWKMPKAEYPTTTGESEHDLIDSSIQKEATAGFRK
jgi:hypothetical protein